MNLHPLDPREPEGARAETWRDSTIDHQWHVRRLDARGQFGPFASEADALGTLRRAAGFGHVAEQPCSVPWSRWTPKYDASSRHFQCEACAWPRDAHQR